MNNFEEILKNGEFLGIVEDNLDPDKKQRIRIRIPFLHGEKTDIPTDALPWAQPKRDNNGLTFSVPDTNKVVNVFFPSGNLYYPVYDNAQHLNINLQKKIEGYSDNDYSSFIALLYNHNTQIYIENEKGLNIIHKFNGINITKDQIALNLRDNNSTLYLGDPNAGQEVVLGTNFFKWFDSLMQVWPQAFIGNMGALTVPSPQLQKVVLQYNALRQDFLSQHIYAIENNQVRSKDFDVVGQIGDNISLTTKEKQLNIKTEEISKPAPITEDRGIIEQNDYVAPQSANSDENIPNTNPPIESSGNIKVDKMIRYLQSQGYTYYTEPFHMNIVGIRNSDKDNGKITNIFDDEIFLFFKNNDNVWETRTYKITTTPGYKPRTNVLPNGPGHDPGVAYLLYGQYRDKWMLGYHQNRTGKVGGKINNRTGQLFPEHKALVDAETAYIRNTPGGTEYLLTNNKPKKTGKIGINIHRSSETGTSAKVDNYSEGCQVFSSKNNHNEFIELCQKQLDNTKFGRFTYTLIPSGEYNDFQ